jgi:hypothetical protein
MVRYCCEDFCNSFDLYISWNENLSGRLAMFLMMCMLFVVACLYEDVCVHEIHEYMISNDKSVSKTFDSLEFLPNEMRRSECSKKFGRCRRNCGLILSVALSLYISKPESCRVPSSPNLGTVPRYTKTSPLQRVPTCLPELCAPATTTMRVMSSTARKMDYYKANSRSRSALWPLSLSPAFDSYIATPSMTHQCLSATPLDP